MAPIDWTKPVQTKENPPRRVTIFTTEAKGDFPVVAQIDDNLDYTIRRYTIEGTGISSFDLENVPEEKKKGIFWININEFREDKIYDCKTKADAFANSDRIACVRVEWTEGEGL